MPSFCNSQDIFLKSAGRGGREADDSRGGMRSWGSRGRSQTPPRSKGYGKYSYGKGKGDWGKGGKDGYWVWTDAGGSSKGSSPYGKGDWGKSKGKVSDDFGWSRSNRGRDYEKGKGKTGSRNGKKGGKGTEDVSSGALDDSLDAYFGRKPSAKAESKEKAVKSAAPCDKDLDDQLSKYMGSDKADDTKGDKENKNNGEAEAEAKPTEKAQKEGVAEKSDAKIAEEPATKKAKTGEAGKEPATMEPATK